MLSLDLDLPAAVSEHCDALQREEALALCRVIQQRINQIAWDLPPGVEPQLVKLNGEIRYRSPFDKNKTVSAEQRAMEERLIELMGRGVPTPQATPYIQTSRTYFQTRETDEQIRRRVLALREAKQRKMELAARQRLDMALEEAAENARKLQAAAEKTDAAAAEERTLEALQDLEEDEGSGYRRRRLMEAVRMVVLNGPRRRFKRSIAKRGEPP